MRTHNKDTVRMQNEEAERGRTIRTQFTVRIVRMQNVDAHWGPRVRTQIKNAR